MTDLLNVISDIITSQNKAVLVADHFRWQISKMADPQMTDLSCSPSGMADLLSCSPSGMADLKSMGSQAHFEDSHGQRSPGPNG